ncbi:MAG: 50S ribosomal protein L15 [Alphaproteobacteria bacterium]|nr:50S ribosomal protein L15 [Alphaproteobacteria bacterium]
MKLNELKPKAGSVKACMRVGRGIGSGKGKTCGSGQKGQKSRSGVAIKGFEGGQMPLYQRLPKFGFSNVKFATKYAELTLVKLQHAVDTKKIDTKKQIDEDVLVAAGVVRRKRDGIKILATGELKAKLNLKVSKVTKGALAQIEKAGGKVELIEKVVAPVKKRGEK